MTVDDAIAAATAAGWLIEVDVDDGAVCHEAWAMPGSAIMGPWTKEKPLLGAVYQWRYPGRPMTKNNLRLWLNADASESFADDGCEYRIATLT